MKVLKEHNSKKVRKFEGKKHQINKVYTMHFNMLS